MEPQPDILEVIVIGAGIIGSATAYYLAKELGNRVLLVEQFDFLHRRGSSHGESRICRLTYPQDYYTFLMTHAYPAWSEAESEAGTKVFRQTGGLDFGPSDDEELLLVLSAIAKWNIPHQILSPSEVTSKFPPISLPPNYIGIYSPNSGVLNASKAVSMYQILARQNHCRLLDNFEITAIRIKKTVGGDELFEIEGISNVDNSRRVIQSKKCVLTAGCWTQPTLDKVTIEEEDKGEVKFVPLGLKLPLTPIQSTVAYFRVENPSEYSGLNGKFPVFISYREHVYGGPALEFPNLIKIGIHGSFNRCDVEKRDFQPEIERLEEEVSSAFLGKIFSRVEKSPINTETCMLTRTPDFDFILDKIEGHGGLVVGCGFSGHGFKLAPVVGQILKGFVMKGESPFPTVQNYFRIDRFKK